MFSNHFCLFLTLLRVKNVLLLIYGDRCRERIRYYSGILAELDKKHFIQTQQDVCPHFAKRAY